MNTNKQGDGRTFNKTNNQFERKLSGNYFNFKDNDSNNKRKTSVSRQYNKIRTTTITRTEIIQTYNKEDNINIVNDTDLKFVRADEINNQNKFIKNDLIQNNIIENNRQINYNTSFVQILNMNNSKVNKHSAGLMNPNAMAQITKNNENYYKTMAPNNSIVSLANGKNTNDHPLNGKITKNIQEDESINDAHVPKNIKGLNCGKSLIPTKHASDTKDCEPYKPKPYYKATIPGRQSNNNSFMQNCNRVTDIFNIPNNINPEINDEIREYSIDMKNQTSESSVQMNTFMEYRRSVRKANTKKQSTTATGENLLLPLHITPGVNLSMNSSTNVNSPRALLMVSKGKCSPAKDRQLDGM